jgi:hypothetical protein
VAKTCLITLTSDDLVNSCTPSWSVPDPDPEYDAANVKDYNPQNITKAGATSATLTLGSHGSGTPLLVGVMNHNAVGRTVTLNAVGGGGGSQSLTIPARTLDGQCTNIFFDLRQTGSMTAADHALVFSGGSGVPALGRVCLPTVVYVVRWQVGRGGAVEYEIQWPNSTERTYLEVDITYDHGVRLRRAGGIFAKSADQIIAQAVMTSASRSCSSPTSR